MSNQNNNKPVSNSKESIDRRAYLSALAAGGGTALAGCSALTGGDGESSGDGENSGEGSSSGGQGERVPKLQMNYMAGLGDSTQVMEDSLAIASQNMKEHLGVQAKPVPKEFATVLKNVYDDARTCTFQPNTLTLNPRRLDPTEILLLNTIWTAGANGRVNHTQLANCEYSKLVKQQMSAGSRKKRKEIVHEALSVLSEEVAELSLFNRAVYGAYRTDQLDIDDTGQAGMMDTNVDVLVNSGVKGDNDKVMNIATSMVKTKTFMNSTDATAISLWNNLIHSPLLQYDRNWELTSNFATDWEVSNEFKTLEFSLQEGATFHNGDKITAEDVKWTYEFLEDNSDVYGDVQSWPYDSIEVVDDYTVRINLTETSPAFISQHVAVWGILHKQTWLEGGAKETPKDVQIDTMVGSGPYKVDNFKQNQLLLASPHDGHWNTPDGRISLKVFQDSQSAYRAFQDGTLNMFVGMPAGIADSISNEMSDTAKATTVQGFTTWSMNPQTNFGPTKFREFRMAVSQSLNRKKMNQVANYGNAMIMEHSSPLSPTHPYYPENDKGLTKIADSVKGSPDKARQILKDAGWSWDDQGRLHYPPDADLEPRWPKGKTPMDYPDKFSCVSELEGM